MGNRLHYENLKSVIYALALIGVGVLIFGFIRFVTLSQSIENNYAYKFRAQNTSVQQLDEATGRVLMLEDLKLRDLQKSRSEAVIITGAGVILTAAVWLVNDLLRGRVRSAASTA